MTKTEHFQAIANALGATFKSSGEDSDSARGNITMPDGVRFFVVTGGYSHKGKINVSSSFGEYQHGADGSKRNMSQRDFNNGEYFDGINISATKTPEQAAKDIQRRFLPTYAPLWAAALAYAERQAEYWKGFNAVAAVAAEVLAPYGYQNKTVQARLSYNNGQTVRIEVDNLDADKLRKLGEFLKTL